MYLGYISEYLGYISDKIADYNSGHNPQAVQSAV